LGDEYELIQRTAAARGLGTQGEGRGGGAAG